MTISIKPTVSLFYNPATPYFECPEENMIFNAKLKRHIYCLLIWLDKNQLKLEFLKYKRLNLQFK